jgi:hypothetical protein
MNAELVTAPEFPSFLERFSRGHEGWLTRLDIQDETHRGEVETSEEPLSGIVADTQGDRLLVFLRNSERGSSRYSIDHPTNIWRENTGEAVRLEVASGDGATTVVECRRAAH